MDAQATLKRARAAVLNEMGSSYVMQEIDVPQPGPDEVLIRLEASGICHSDLAAHTPSAPEDITPIRPLIGGHEGVGKIVAVGEGVVGRRIGEDVGLAFIASNCGSCEACIKGGLTLCPDATFRGFTVAGTFAEYTISKAAHAIPVPQSIPPAEACPILCAGLTVYKALKLLSPVAGQWVAVPGAGGGLGHLAVQYAKAFGLRVVGIDSTSKEGVARSSGAEAFVDFAKSKDVVGDVLKATDGGAHYSLLCVAHGGGYTDALKYARVFGKIACIGLTPFSTHSALLIEKQLTLIGTHVGTPTDAVEALSFVERGLVRCRVKAVDFSAENIEATFDALKKGTVEGRVIMTM
ncbi:hypothetical protein JCM10212_003554 [Sporobolomyces blumeae]